MREEKYYEILAIIETLRKMVIVWNERLMAEGKTATHLQEWCPWTTKTFPYSADDSEKKISMLIRYFNDCYLKEVCWILRESQLTTNVPSWVTAPRDIIDAINNTGQLMREIMYAHKQIRLSMIDVPSLPQDASIEQITNTLAGFRYNLEMQSGIIASKNQPK